MRKKEAYQMLEEMDVPVDALVPRQAVQPVSMLHIGRRMRDRMHTVQGLRMPCERSIRQCKERLLVSAGTAVGSFFLADHAGAYVQDPARLMTVLGVGGESPVCVGGDKGSDFTKLGVTYLDAKHHAHFQALVVYEGEDNYAGLSELLPAGLTVFVRDSAAFSNIFDYLQSLLDDGAFLNGDWPFISALLALKGPNANYPCFICTQSKRHFNEIAVHRDPTFHGGTIRNPPLLKCPPNRIVPTPLHLFLGIGNRVIDKMLVPMFTKPTVVSALAVLKSKHTFGCGGLADLYGLSGPELTRFIRQRTPVTLGLTRADLSDADRTRLLTITQWLTQLRHFLLHSNQWDEASCHEFRSICRAIITRWHEVTKDHLFPKMHMLLHASEFASTHKLLGRLSESAIESSHAEINELYNKHHHNQTKHPEVRISRSLSGHIHQSVQRVPLGNITNLIAPPKRSNTI
jgi:hypothetical protein